MKKMLLSLFQACLSAGYREVENAASYAYERKETEEGIALTLFFEQSNGRVDWLNNLDFVARPYEEMDPPWRCHAGFLKVFKSLLPYLEPHLRDPAVGRVTVVGYSHGAALALLFHESVWYHRPDLREKLSGFGFGCPRVLYGCVSPEIAPRWERFYVIRNEDDLVTHLPPRFAGYCHVGNLITVGEAGRYSSVDAHRPESYLAELERLE